MKVPLRRCVGCRQMYEKKSLIRVVKNPDGGFLLDMKGKQDGRGAYICKNADCISKASKSFGFERSFGVKKRGNKAQNQSGDICIYTRLMNEMEIER